MGCGCNLNNVGLFRLTTPTHEFVTDLDPNEWESFIISYSQHDQTILEKTEEDLIAIEDHRDDNSMPGWYLIIRLTQEETARFTPKEKCYIQVRCKYDSDAVFASEKIMVSVDDVINQTVM